MVAQMHGADGEDAANAASGSSTVIYHDGFTQSPAQALRNETCLKVGVATRRKRNDQCYWFRRIFEGGGKTGCEKHNRAQQQPDFAHLSNHLIRK
jgi:hypothetical protein